MAITIPEKNKKTFLKTRDILLKYKTYQATIRLKQFFLEFCRNPIGGLTAAPQIPSANFFPYITRLVSVNGQLPLHKLNSCIKLPYVYPISSFLLEVPSSREDFQKFICPIYPRTWGGGIPDKYRYVYRYRL